MARSIFDTSTFKSARVAMIAGAAVAIVNILNPLLLDFFPAQAKNITQAVTLLNTVAGFVGIGGGAGTVLGRAKAVDPVESPAWMPGANFGELAERQEKEDKLDQVLDVVAAIAPNSTVANIGRSIADIAREVDL